MALVTSHHPSPVYLVDFSVYQPPEEYKVDRAKSEEAGKSWSVSVVLAGLPERLGLFHRLRSANK